MNGMCLTESDSRVQNPKDISPVERLRYALPDLPPRLGEAARYLLEHQFDVTTKSMRDIAASANMQPAVFTRLAQALGWSGWDAFRVEVVEARRLRENAPFSSRVTRTDSAHGSIDRHVAAILDADTMAIAQADVGAIVRAAAAITDAPRIWVVGYRSCRSIAELLVYQFRMFRDDVHLVGGVGPEDFDLAEFREGDVVTIICFAPYSRSVMAAFREARRAKCTLVVIDQPNSRNAEGAHHYISFDASGSPSFFPSLVGAVALIQALAGAAFKNGGRAASDHLKNTEARLLAKSEYEPES